MRAFLLVLLARTTARPNLLHPSRNAIPQSRGPSFHASMTGGGNDEHAGDRPGGLLRDRGAGPGLRAPVHVGRDRSTLALPRAPGPDLLHPHVVPLLQRRGALPGAGDLAALRRAWAS